ncbi:hypothetical protein KR009_010265 [Drosophila setifemur]|nr:hypothetical protein KR009_010265 [Drosophila setifemur]
MLLFCVVILLLNGKLTSSIMDSVNPTETSQDYALSQIHMMPLLQLKERAVENLHSYAMVLAKRLTYIKLLITQLVEFLKPSNGFNPFLKLKVSRQLHFDWPSAVVFLKNKAGLNEIRKSQRLRPMMPTIIAYNEALYAIHRLQSTYKLEPAEMSIGFFRGKQYRCKKWSSIECLMIGSVYYLDEKFLNSERWFQLALEKYNQHPNPRQLEIFGWTSAIIVKLLMKSAHSSGRYKAALEYAEKGLSLEPNLTNWHQISRLKILSKLPEVIKPEEAYPHIFKTTCSMEYKPKYLKCRYIRSSSFLSLAPMQMEELNIDPPIYIYHNLVTDEEISLLKNLSNPHLKRSQFYSEGTHKVIEDFSNLRTCKSMRLKDEGGHSLLSRLNRRVTDATGLSVKEAEMLQISNYGIGGHLFEHQDFTNSLESAFWNSGNRIITAFNVEQGGETVFPHLRLRVATKKGSLLVWNNLLLDGSTDSRVLHISCPVLFGDKWSKILLYFQRLFL